LNQKSAISAGDLILLSKFYYKLKTGCKSNKIEEKEGGLDDVKNI